MDISNYKKTITELTQYLTKLEVYAKNLEMENSRVTLHELNERIGNDRFNLAVLGEFRRGKSTLINALLRTPVLPSDIVPTTASVNRITYDLQPHAKVEYFNGSTQDISIEDLDDYATQYGEKSDNVREVTVWYPTVYCSNNVDIYDTPGLNDSPEMNKAAMDVISRMDVAIFTLSASMNFSMSECKFIGEKLLTSNVERVIFVITHMGQYTPEQQTRIIQSIRKRIEEMVLAKASDVLSDKPEELEAFRRKLSNIQVFGVDSVMALEARQNYDATLLEMSGFTAFERAIDELLTRERGRVMLEKQTGAIMKAASDIFNVIQTRMGPLTMDEAEFVDRCKSAEKQITTIEVTMNSELERLESASQQIKEQVRGEWEDYVDKIKAEIEEIAKATKISMRDLTPKGRKRVCEDVWEKQMAPAITRCLQIYSEKIQNSVSESVGKECKKLDSYMTEISQQLNSFTKLFTPADSLKDDARGQVISYALLGSAGKIGYTTAGAKGAVVSGLSGMAATVATTAALTWIVLALGLPVTAPATLAITLVSAAANTFTGKKLAEHLFWRESADRFRADMAKTACEQLDAMLVEINFTRQVEDYIANIFSAIKKEITANTTDSLKDMQKALLTTHENFAAEKAQVEQKLQNYTTILESLSAITDRTASVRETYGLDVVAAE